MRTDNTVQCLSRCLFVRRAAVVLIACFQSTVASPIGPPLRQADREFAASCLVCDLSLYCRVETVAIRTVLRARRHQRTLLPAAVSAAPLNRALIRHHCNLWCLVAEPSITCRRCSLCRSWTQAGPPKTSAACCTRTAESSASTHCSIAMFVASSSADDWVWLISQRREFVRVQSDGGRRFRPPAALSAPHARREADLARGRPATVRVFACCVPPPC